jgi:hypothetical protein
MKDPEMLTVQLHVCEKDIFDIIYYVTYGNENISGLIECSFYIDGQIKIFFYIHQIQYLT